RAAFLCWQNQQRRAWLSPAGEVIEIVVLAESVEALALLHRGKHQHRGAGSFCQGLTARTIDGWRLFFQRARERRQRQREQQECNFAHEMIVSSAREMIADRLPGGAEVLYSVASRQTAHVRGSCRNS